MTHPCFTAERARQHRADMLSEAEQYRLLHGGLSRRPAGGGGARPVPAGRTRITAVPANRDKAFPASAVSPNGAARSNR